MANFQKERNPAGGPGFEGAYAGGAMHFDHASAEPLLQRLEGVKRAGKGWRARCPSCGGTSAKLSVAENDGRVLVHCFAGCLGDAVLNAVGLRWAELYPPRHWPRSSEECEQSRRAIRDAGIRSALEVLACECAVIEAAGRTLQGWGYPSIEDDQRLSLAVERVFNVRSILCRPQPWRQRS